MKISNPKSNKDISDNRAYKYLEALQKFHDFSKEKNFSNFHKSDKSKQDEIQALKNAKNSDCYEEYHRIMIDSLNTSFLQVIKGSFQKESKTKLEEEAKKAAKKSRNRVRGKGARKVGRYPGVVGEGTKNFRSKRAELAQLTEEIKRIHILPYTEHSKQRA